jgi:hypothetical protein
MVTFDSNFGELACIAVGFHGSRLEHFANGVGHLSILDTHKSRLQVVVYIQGREALAIYHSLQDAISDGSTILDAHGFCSFLRAQTGIRFVPVV